MNEESNTSSTEQPQPVEVKRTKPARKARTKKETTKTMATATARKTKRSKRSSNSDSNPMAVLSERRDQYKVDKANRTAGGNPSVSCGDVVAKALVGLSVEDLAKIAKDNGVADRWSAWTKANLNPGQLRMNLGNVLRGILRRGESKVTVKGKALAGKALKS